MRTASLALVALMGLFMATAFADPVGNYWIQGSSPNGGGSYQGTVTVQRTGENYSVEWVVDGTSFVGTGLGVANQNGQNILGPADPVDNGLSIAYVAGDSFGVAIMVEDYPGQWSGFWTEVGSTALGREVWTRR
jgi:hypothetical protein